MLSNLDLKKLIRSDFVLYRSWMIKTHLFYSFNNFAFQMKLKKKNFYFCFCRAHMRDLGILSDVAYSHAKLHAKLRTVYYVKSVYDNFIIGAKSCRIQPIKISKRKKCLMCAVKNVIIQCQWRRISWIT